MKILHVMQRVLLQMATVSIFASIFGTLGTVYASENPPPAASIATVTPSSGALLKIGSTSASASALNESLSLLGYLPLAFHPAHGLTSRAAMTTLQEGSKPLPGKYTWKNKASAQALGSLWKPFTMNVITQGAVMRFELDHHLIVDGVVGPKVWTALHASLRKGHGTTKPYVFVTVDERSPEMLRVWMSGKVVLASATNTGVAQSPTSIGTWPIYLRYQSQEMRGTTPWGTTYADPGVPYVNYFHGGDAIHGFIRASYGTPQSLGCVELPIAMSKRVFSLVNYGTLVTVRAK